MQALHLGAATAVLLACTAPAVSAQGFWAGAAVGSDRQQVTCDICRGKENGGWAARLAAGGTLSPRLRLGGELYGWTDETDDVRLTFLALTPTVYWWPRIGQDRPYSGSGVHPPN